MLSCEGCLAKFSRQANLMQHLEKSTNLLCVDARQAFRDKMRPIKGKRHASDLPKADIEDSEDSDSDLEDAEGGFVDLNLMPVEVGEEGHNVEAEIDANLDEEEDNESI
jgi:hypothetical protein